MRKRYRYKSLKDTLKQLKAQALEGVRYMEKTIPAEIGRPADLFYYLKRKTTYEHDPKGIELIHSPQTLFQDNYHGTPGAGDCDDFTMLSIAALLAIGVPQSRIKIVLVGRNPKTPRHIYLYVDGVPFDLTNDRIGQERPYPYRQFIPLPIL